MLRSWIHIGFTSTIIVLNKNCDHQIVGATWKFAPCIFPYVTSVMLEHTIFTLLILIFTATVPSTRPHIPEFPAQWIFKCKRMITQHLVHPKKSWGPLGGTTKDDKGLRKKVSWFPEPWLLFASLTASHIQNTGPHGEPSHKQWWWSVLRTRAVWDIHLLWGSAPGWCSRHGTGRGQQAVCRGKQNI